jgi:hypothetical protein
MINNLTFRTIIRDEVHDRLGTPQEDRNQKGSVDRAIEAAIDILLDPKVVAQARELSKR